MEGPVLSKAEATTWLQTFPCASQIFCDVDPLFFWLQPFAWASPHGKYTQIYTILATTATKKTLSLSLLLLRERHLSFLFLQILCNSSKPQFVIIPGFLQFPVHSASLHAF